MNLFENLQIMKESKNKLPHRNIKLNESKNKSLKCEAILKPFTSQDWYGFQGANKFNDGSQPLIAYGDFGTLIVAGSDDPNDKGVLITIYFGEDNEQWAWKSYDDKETALKDAKYFAQLIDEDIDENQLNRFGFEIMH